MLIRSLTLTPAQLRRTLVRVLVAAGAVAAYLFTASLFDPQKSRATEITAPNDFSPGPHPPTTTSTPPLNTNASDPARSSVSPAPERRSLGTLKGLDKSLHVFASPDGPRYTVTDSLGNTLATNLSADAVYRDFPELTVDTMQATPTATADIND